MTSAPGLVALACVALASAVPLVSSVPMDLQQQQQQKPQEQQKQQQKQDDGVGAYAPVFWSVLDDCFGGEDVVGTATVCLKSKALTALDRALSKPTVAVADGVSLAARAGRSLQFDRQTDEADRAALDAAKDPDQKNALLDDMLANRIDALVSSRTIVMDAPADQEGRGKKKGDKALKQAMMMMGMMTIAVMGPFMMKIMSLIAIKALVVSKIALVLSIIMVVKKLMSQKHGGGGGGGGGGSGHSSYEAEPAPYARSMQLDAHDMAYSGQKQ